MRRSVTTLCIAAAVLAGCAAQQMHEQGMRHVAEGNTEAALAALKQASTMDPGNARYRIDYLAQRALMAQASNTKGDQARNAGQLDEAVQHYDDVLRWDPMNDRAQRGLKLVQDQRKARAAVAEVAKAMGANNFALAQDIARRAAKELPHSAEIQALVRSLDEKAEADRVARERLLASQTVFRRPVTLQFREANLKMVFEALSRTAGVNIILDREVKNDLKTTIYVKDASVEDTIDLILLQNQLEKRVLNSNTMFVYPAAAAKQREYSELKVRTFQLNNVEAAHAANLVKTLLKTKDVVVDPRSNTLVIRDTADAIAVAERVIAASDLPEPEVMLEVEILEVAADRLSNIGIKWPDTLTLSTPDTVKTVGDLRALPFNGLNVTPLAVTLNLMLQDTDTNILASPRIRTRNKEKARVMVGDKVPVITNLLTPQLAGQTSVLTGSIQYVDIGLKLEVEPQVYSDGDVGIKLVLEVSNIVKTIETTSGIAYQIGTRNAQTSLRLRDGETQVLAGLISDQDKNTANKVPGLGQVPGVGRLFSSHNGNTTKTEIVLSITPRIVRAQTVADARYGDVWSGTEALVRDRQLRLDPITAAKLTSSVEPAATNAGAAAGNAPGRAPGAGDVPPAGPAAAAPAPAAAAAPPAPATASPSASPPTPVFRRGRSRSLPTTPATPPPTQPAPEPGTTQ